MIIFPTINRRINIIVATVALPRGVFGFARKTKLNRLSSSSLVAVVVVLVLVPWCVCFTDSRRPSGGTQLGHGVGWREDNPPVARPKLPFISARWDLSARLGSFRIGVGGGGIRECLPVDFGPSLMAGQQGRDLTTKRAVVEA